MRNWGIAITVFYALTVTVLVIPAAGFLMGIDDPMDLGEIYADWIAWIFIVPVIGGQALLLFLSVDTSHRRLRPRQHVMVTVTVTGLLLGLLALAVLTSLGAGIFGDDAFQFSVIDSAAKLLGWWAALWLFWAIVFYTYCRESSELVRRATSWLLRGSVLELLVAVPCHVITRQREDCCAPAVTGLGMATGIAIMLLSFGPSVLLLYKNRMDRYANRGKANA